MSYGLVEVVFFRTLKPLNVARMVLQEPRLLGELSVATLEHKFQALANQQRK